MSSFLGQLLSGPRAEQRGDDLPTLVRSTRDALLQKQPDQSKSGETSSADNAVLEDATLQRLSEKTARSVSGNLAAMKTLLYGTPGKPPNRGEGSALLTAILDTELLQLLLARLPVLEFECRKDVSQVFSNLLRRPLEGEGDASITWPAVEWLERRPSILHALLQGYAHTEVALNYGVMLRECVRHERLARVLLPSAGDHPFYGLFTFVESPFFDVASDAFASLKELLTKHKELAAKFLSTHYEVFFNHYEKLVTSENYVTKRQSLKLLGEILLDRTNFAIMTRYIASSSNLKSVMILLKDESSSIQYEAFHVFKIFVANPHKESRVLEMLLRNKDRLIEFMSTFQTHRSDEQFVEEKQFLVREIQRLESPT